MSNEQEASSAGDESQRGTTQAGDSAPSPAGADQPPAAPPTQRMPHANHAPRTVWPTVLAIIAFVWGGFSLLSSGCTIGMAPFYDWFADAMEDHVPAEQTELYRQFADLWVYWIVTGLIGLVLAALLLVAGAHLLKRKARARMLCMLWSILSIIQMILATVINTIVVDVTNQAAGSMHQFSQIGALVGAVFGLALGIALPVFFLIWFARPRIRAEVARWRNESQVD